MTSGQPSKRISRRSNWPLYLQIADDLREQVLQQKLTPGERLPSEHSLMEAYDTSRQTIRKAIGVLKTEGLIETAQGQGAFVRAKAPVLRVASDRLSRHRWAIDEKTFLYELKTAGHEPRIEREAGQAPAPTAVASRLGLREGTPVLVWRWQMFADDEPLQLATSYLPLELLRGLTRDQPDTPEGVYLLLEELGYRLDHLTEHILSRMPQPGEARALDLSPGTPVILVSRIASTVEGRPIEVCDAVMAADRYELLYEIPAGERVCLVTSVDELTMAMIKVVREARECIVAVGSRSREPAYFNAIEEALKAQPRVVHYRLLIGPPHRQVFKDHLLRLLEIRNPESREYGIKTIYMGMVDDQVREPERFFIASERAAVITLPSVNTAGNFDTGVILDDPRDAQGLVRHAKEIYAGTKRLETIESIEKLSVLR